MRAGQPLFQTARHVLFSLCHRRGTAICNYNLQIQGQAEITSPGSAVARLQSACGSAGAFLTSRAARSGRLLESEARGATPLPSFIMRAK